MPVCEKQVVRFGPFELNVQSDELSKHGLKSKLQGQPIQILKLLLSKAGELVTRDEIRENLWPADTFVDFEHSLNTAVKKLRGALGDEADTPRYIETLPRRGYRFIAEIERVQEKSQPAQPSVEPVVVPVETLPKPQTLGPQTRSRWSTRGKLVVAGAVIAIILAAGWYMWRPNSQVGKIESIAVLPLANFSGDAEQEYFADGITEELISDLSQIKALRVISRTSVMRYKGTKKTLTEIGRDLGVDAIVEGSVQRAGNRVRIAAQLVRADSEQHLWADTYERDLKDVLNLRNEIASAIAEKIKVEITPQERDILAQSNTVVPEAYVAYLKGRHVLDRLTIDGLLKATENFEEAVRLDPNYAKAWAALGHTYFLIGFQSELPPSSRCLPAMKRAVELAPNLAEAHVNLADLKFHRDWKWLEGEAEFRHSVELDPRSIDAHQHYALSLWQLARFDAAIREMKATLALDPLSAGLNFGLAGLYRDAHQRDKALEQYRRTLELEPNSFPAHLGLATFYEELGREKEAQAEYAKAATLSGDSADRVEALLKALQSGGTRTYWRKTLEFLQQDAKKKHVPPMNFASVYAHLDEKQNALHWLELAFAQHNPKLSWIKAQTNWDPLRSESRFKDLLARMNFPDENAAEPPVTHNLP
jgi:TolB-like protein/DNA-binding winged helix-turn-helix (wHTH) protein/Flp pilus assembly protein TadD